MKKLVLAASITLGFSGGAFAQVTIDGRAPAVPAKGYANELVVNNSTTIAGLAVVNDLGFGVSGDQTRFIRYDMTNAKFNAAVPCPNVLGCAVQLAPVVANAVVSQGGGINDTFVIFQITAAPAGNQQTDDVTFTLPTVKVSDKSGSAILRYRLYESAADAAAGTTAGLLKEFSGAVANFPTGVIFATTPNTTTADVTTLYKNFKTGGATPGVTATLAKIGTVTYQVDTSVNDPADGLALAAADIVQFIAAGSKFKLEGGDLTAASAVGALFLAANTGTCSVPGVSTPATAKTATTAEFVFGATESLARELCFTANGATPIATQTFTVAADLVAGTTVPGGVPADTRDQAAKTAGEFNRDGTVLKAAFAEGSGVSGVASAVSLTNTSGNPANFTTSCLTGTGTVAGNPGTVPAMSGLRFGITSAAGLGCPTAVRGIEMTFSVPVGSVIGSVVRQNTTTGQAAFDGMVGNQ